ncbi:hypothetical protein H8356DRAFT_1426541 [Neocallimastix lanati (nom. inval.)]|nr:hypothetical protein H8356DRAFT_1426541 [Neocallimastix sp. JGI-2020a]
MSDNTSNNNSDFIIDNKKEFLLTYGNDYWGALKIDNIRKLFNDGLWFYVISKETGHEVTDHDHYHVYLKYIGPNKKGFRARGKNAQFIWDVPLTFDNDTLKNKFNSDSWPLNKEKKKIIIGHPNIKFKGDKIDINCKNSFTMIDYVTKQRKDKDESDWIIVSNFDWQEELKKLKPNEKRSTSRVNEEEFQFTCWIRDQIFQRQKATKKEIIRDILKNDNFNYLYMSKYNNYNKLINDLFRNKPKSKPIPYWGNYWIPVELKNYLDYLNNWFELWSKKKQPVGSRPKPLYLSGCGSSGKSSLIACMGTFSYWCNVWNYNNWEGEASFNFFDDYDGSEDYKGNQVNYNWTIMKPWIGGQPSVTISGKYKEPETVDNDKPCVFVSNKTFEDRFPPDAREYWKDVGATIVELGKYRLNKTPLENGISRKTIGGFAGWVQYNTKNTFYYNNFINKNENKNKDNSNKTKKGKEPETDNISNNLIEPTTSNLKSMN